MQPSIPDKIISAANAIERISSEKTREELIFLINELINKDFQSLIQLLYRIDVNEKKNPLLFRRKFAQRRGGCYSRFNYRKTIPKNGKQEKIYSTK